MRFKVETVLELEVTQTDVQALLNWYKDISVDVPTLDGALKSVATMVSRGERPEVPGCIYRVTNQKSKITSNE